MYLKDSSLISLAFLRLRRMQDGLEKEVLGILVSYKIKINLMVAGGGCVSASLTPVLAQRNVFFIEIKRPLSIFSYSLLGGLTAR